MTSAGIWVIARTPMWAPYPCACWLGRRCVTGLPTSARTCTCWGRTDVAHTPIHCCSRASPYAADNPTTDLPDPN